MLQNTTNFLSSMFPFQARQGHFAFSHWSYFENHLALSCNFLSLNVSSSSYYSNQTVEKSLPESHLIGINTNSWIQLLSFSIPPTQFRSGTNSLLIRSHILRQSSILDMPLSYNRIIDENVQTDHDDKQKFLLFEDKNEEDDELLSRINALRPIVLELKSMIPIILDVRNSNDGIVKKY